MQFLADMGTAQSTVKWLKEQEHDATHVRDFHMHRASDEEIIARTRQDGGSVLYMTDGPALRDAENVRL